MEFLILRSAVWHLKSLVENPRPFAPNANAIGSLELTGPYGSRFILLSSPPSLGRIERSSEVQGPVGVWARVQKFSIRFRVISDLDLRNPLRPLAQAFNTLSKNTLVPLASLNCVRSSPSTPSSPLLRQTVCRKPRSDIWLLPPAYINCISARKSSRKRSEQLLDCLQLHTVPLGEQI